ncbi:MAG TPA: hypothetical protein VFQ74_10975 [Pseudolysinimonas sp.]|nr:hypothetical protein [Pseudolysinimonas sp.]
MSRPSSRLGKYLGSVASWLLFAFCFTLLAVGATIVMGLGGFCTSGGAYVIQTACPSVVAWSAPLSIFGGLIAVGIGVIVAGGFGTPLVSWAWPILFVGLGLAFAGSGIASGVDGIVFDLLALRFLVMGGVPLVLEFRADPQAFFLGTTNADGAPFLSRETGHRSLYSFTRAGERTQPHPGQAVDGDAEDLGSHPNAAPIAPTARDWALSLGILLVFGGLGVFLALQIFAAAGSHG